MSVRQGNKVIAGHINYHPDLFDHKWADHLLNDISWLRADTFSWQDGGVYEAAYNHLADDISGKGLSSETIAGITVQFYLADDGHKICPDSQESNVVSIYNATGVTWYYIIDTVNERFKLPRTKYGFDGLRGNVGDYVPESLPDHTHTVSIPINHGWNGNVYIGGSDQNYVDTTKTFTSGSASASSSAYQNGAPVQERATQQYLYFYVGNFTQTAIENTAGLNASLFNGKADIDLTNVSSAGKAESVSWGIPDYASVISGSGVARGTWVQCTVDSFVCTYGTDGYQEDYRAYVSPDKTTTYTVGYRYDDTNANTEGVSFTFFVPKGWWFQNNAENGFSYKIYPLKGAA